MGLVHGGNKRLGLDGSVLTLGMVCPATSTAHMPSIYVVYTGERSLNS